MHSFDPQTLPTATLHQYLVGAVAPRPIAFVSTVDAEGNANLAPYSFFNVFSSNPPIAVFSSNRRVSNNTTKDTLANVEATRQAVINVVNYDMTRQMALTSAEYPSDVSEFEKAGFTPVASEKVKPARVAESPVQFECEVQDILPLGEEGGAGHLVICKIVHLHISESVLDEDGKMNPQKLDLVGRMGRAFYARASGDAIFSVYQNVTKPGIGFDQLPLDVRESKVLSGWQLAELAAVTALPEAAVIAEAQTDPAVMNALAGNTQERATHLHRLAAGYVDAGEITKAWAILLQD